MFSKEILITDNVFSAPNQKGKMAIRVFTPWSQLISDNNKRFYEEKNLKIKPTNEFSVSAKKAQKWQLDNFINLTYKNNLDKIKEKISINSCVIE